MVTDKNILSEKVVRFDVKAKINGEIEEIPKILTKWKILEENFSEKLLTDLFEIDIISLRKLKLLKSKNKEVELIDLNEKVKLIQWLKFIKNPRMLEEDVMENNKSIKEANEIYESVMSDAERVRLAELRAEKSSLEDSRWYCGIEEGKKEVARKMLLKKRPIKEIIEFTGLTQKEIEEL